MTVSPTAKANAANALLRVCTSPHSKPSMAHGYPQATGLTVLQVTHLFSCAQ